MLDCTSRLMAVAFQRIFADTETPSPPSFDAAAFERRVAFETLDRAASRVIICKDEPVATILVARRGRTAHISGLGVQAAYRRQGIAARLIAQACEEARARGDQHVMVEVATDKRRSTPL
jgi:ribosomal protein S18 acetylase RimI-like enzyme